MNAFSSSVAPGGSRPFLDATRAWRESRDFQAGWSSLWAPVSAQVFADRALFKSRSAPEGFPACAQALLANREEELMRAIQSDPRLAIAPICLASKNSREQQPLFAWAALVKLHEPARWVSQRLLEEARPDELVRALGDPPEPLADRPGYLSGVVDRSESATDRLFWRAVALRQRSGDNLFCRALSARPQLAAEPSDFWLLLERASWRQGPYERAVWLSRLSLDPGFAALRERPADAKKIERASRNSLFRLASQKLPLPAELIDALVHSGAQMAPRPLLLARRLAGQLPLPFLSSLNESSGVAPAELALSQGFALTAASLAAKGSAFSPERMARLLPAVSESVFAAFEREILASSSQSIDGGSEPRPARSKLRL